MNSKGAQVNPCRTLFTRQNKADLSTRDVYQHESYRDFFLKNIEGLLFTQAFGERL
jgi:hypothetical protein